MKKGKSTGTSGVVSEMLLASGGVGNEWMINLFNKINAENKVPEDWDRSLIVICFRNKSDLIKKGHYRGLKLLQHMMNVSERVIEQKI